MNKTMLCLLFALLLTPNLCPAASLVTSLPPLEKLETAALSRSGLSPGKVNRWERNSRRAAALPSLQIGYEQKAQIQNTAIIQDSISVTSSGVSIGPEANRVDQDFGNNRGFDVKAVWALDELIFNRDELEVSRESRDLLLVRSRLQEELHTAYYELKTQLLRFELEPETARDPFEILKAQQQMDKLNSLSGGEFYRLAKFSLPSFKNFQPESQPEFHNEKSSAKK